MKLQLQDMKTDFQLFATHHLLYIEVPRPNEVQDARQTWCGELRTCHADTDLATKR